MLGGTDQWDAFPTKEPIDAVAEFKAMKVGIDYQWTHFVIYLTWLTRTLGPECT